MLKAVPHLDCFWNMLAAYVPQTGYQTQNKADHILNICCGSAEESLVLVSYFGGQNDPFQNHPATRMTGIDINFQKIDMAARKFDKFSNIDFVCGDARSLELIKNFSLTADVVLLRHQQVFFDKDIWFEIIMRAIKKLRPGGLLMMTSLEKIEHHFLANYLLNLGQLNIKVNAINSQAYQVNHNPDFNLDHSVLMGIKF